MKRKVQSVSRAKHQASSATKQSKPVKKQAKQASSSTERPKPVKKRTRQAITSPVSQETETETGSTIDDTEEQDVLLAHDESCSDEQALPLNSERKRFRRGKKNEYTTDAIQHEIFTQSDYQRDWSRVAQGPDSTYHWVNTVHHTIDQLNSGDIKRLYNEIRNLSNEADACLFFPRYGFTAGDFTSMHAFRTNHPVAHE